MITVDRFVHYYTLPALVDIMKGGIHLHPDYLENCIEEIKKLGDSQDRQTNLKGFMTSYHVYSETKVLDPILEGIVEVSAMYTNRVFSVSEAWAGIYQKGDYAVEHDHVGSSLSFCYYMQAEEGDAAIEFVDARKKFHPTTGMLLVFPSNFRHKVHEQKTDNERVVLAGNLLYTEQLVDMR